MHIIRVLHILDELNYSGAEVMLRNSAHLFISRGIQLHALSTGQVIGIYSDKLKEAGFMVHHIPFRKNPNFFIEVYKLLKAEKIEVVHIHTERAFFWLSIVSRITGINRIVRTVHNVFNFEGYLRFKRKSQRLISSKSLNVKFISISNSVKQVEEKYFNNKTILIKNWIDDKIFTPPLDTSEKLSVRKTLGISEDKIVIVSIGNCSKVKNHFDILRTLPKLILINNKFIYLHAGEGESTSEEIDLVHELEIADYVKFLGKVENVRQILISSDIFVMTSKYEGIGNTSLEAGSCGLPLLIYDSPGLKETIINGYNGFLIRQDPEHLLEGLKRLISNKELRRELGNNARQFVLKNYNMNDSVNKLIEIYLN